MYRQSARPGTGLTWSEQEEEEEEGKKEEEEEKEEGTATASVGMEKQKEGGGRVKEGESPSEGFLLFLLERKTFYSEFYTTFSDV